MTCGFWTGFLVLPLLFLLLFSLLLLELCCLSSDCLVACKKFVGNFNVTPFVEMPPLQNPLSQLTLSGSISKKTGTKLYIVSPGLQLAEADELGQIYSFHVIPCQAQRLFIIIISSGTKFMAPVFLAPTVCHIS